MTGKPRSTSSRSPISWSMSLWPATPKRPIPLRPAKNGRFHGRRRTQKWRPWNSLKVHYLNPVLLLLVLQTWWDLGWHYHQRWECQLGKMERKLVLDPLDPSIRCLGPSWLEIILHFHPPLQRLHLSKYDQPAEFKRRRWKVKRWEHIFHTEIRSFLHSTSWIFYSNFHFFFCFQFFYDKCLRRNLGRVRWGLEGHSDMNSGIEELTILNRYLLLTRGMGSWMTMNGFWHGFCSSKMLNCSTLSQGECFSWLQSSLGKGNFSKGISQHVLDSAWHGLWFGRHFRIYCIQVSHPNARKSISVFAARISKKKSSQNEEIKLIGPSVVHQILLPCPYGAGLSKICTWRCCSNLGGIWMWMCRAKHFLKGPQIYSFHSFPTRL